MTIFLNEVSFINEGIFEPHKTLVKRREFSYICVCVCIIFND